jgi:predicted CoA-binding protein
MNQDKQEKPVVVLGASPKPERYSNQAVKLLTEHGWRVIPVSPRATEIEGLPAVPDLASVRESVHTLSMYVGPERSAALADEILALAPDRVIFNPGTESPALEERLAEKGIPFEHACTLVLLRSGQF